jgi:hypothetical protein
MSGAATKANRQTRHTKKYRAKDRQRPAKKRT